MTTQLEGLSLKDATFSNLKKLIGNSLDLHERTFDDGHYVKAQVKCTFRGGVIKTAYLHTTIVFPSGRWQYYREQANGKFKLIDFGQQYRLDVDVAS